MVRLKRPRCLIFWTTIPLRYVLGMMAKRARRSDLSWMNDRMLHDIGLTRHDLWSAPSDPLLRDRTAFAGGSRSLAGARGCERSAQATLRRLWAADGGSA